MSMTIQLPLSEAGELSDLVARLNVSPERIVLTQEDGTAVVMLTLDELEGLEESLDILSDTPEVRELSAAIRERAMIPLSEIKADLDARSRHGISG
jgi:PHD/YefM family antitoxin component YafN of YafNO toxin-antitoxin module